MGWISTLGCIVCGSKPVEVAHVGERAFGRKCSDRHTLPLCTYHHLDTKLGHHGAIGRNFWQYWRVDRDDAIRGLNTMYALMTSAFPSPDVY